MGWRPVPRPSKVWNAAIGCRRRLWRKDEFIKVNLELISAHAVIGSDQPLLEIADGAVCQRQYGLRTFPQIDSQGLDARHMLESGFLQPRKAFEAVIVYGRTRHHILFQKNREALCF